MDFDLFALPALLLVATTSLGILLFQSWRWTIACLLIQYLGVATLTALSWPYQMVLTKLVAGWIAGVVLWMAQISLQATHKYELEQAGKITGTSLQTQLSGRLFRIFAAGIVGLVVFSVTPTVADWFPAVRLVQITGSFVLIGFGLLQLGLTSEPFLVVIGLLTVISGFEVIYAGVEISALVQGLLAGVTLGLGVIGAYLILSPTMEYVE